MLFVGDYLLLLHLNKNNGVVALITNMKRFISITLAFLIPLCMILALGEMVVRSYPTSYGLKSGQAQMRHNQVRTIVFGNSRAYYGILTDSLDLALNMANVSQTLEYDSELLLRYFSSASHLRNVIVQVDYSNVFDVPLDESIWDDYRCTYYRIYADCGRHGWLSNYGMELFHPKHFMMKLPHALRYVFTGDYQLDCDSTGFGITTSKRFDASRMSHATANGLARYNAISLESMPYNEQFLCRIAEYCKARNVRLIMVSMPIWRELYNQKGHKEEPLLAKMINKFSRQYGAEYRDYTADSRMVDEDFVDAVHLSPLGACHFTSILNHDFQLDSIN